MSKTRQDPSTLEAIAGELDREANTAKVWPALPGDDRILKLLTNLARRFRMRAALAKKRRTTT